jgi:hypothetical protein
MKKYKKTHLEKKALENHIKAISKRGGNYKVDGLTIKYHFFDAPSIDDNGEFIFLPSKYSVSDFKDLMKQKGYRTVIAPSGLITVTGTMPELQKWRSDIVSILKKFTGDKNID